MNDNRYIEHIDGYIPALDGVRGWSIVMVLLCHAFTDPLFGHIQTESASELSRIEYIFRHLIAYCSLGVDFFFVLSGFLITGILLKALHSRRYFTNFYARRILRISPLYYLYISVIFFLVPFFVNNVRGEIPSYYYISYYCYLQNFWNDINSNGLLQHLLGHLWSLAVEEHFYLVWPLIVWGCVLSNSGGTEATSDRGKGLRRLRSVTIFLLLFTMFFRSAVLVFSDIELIRVGSWTFCRMDSILVGALLAICLRSQLRPWLEKWRLQLLFAAVVLCLTVIIIDATFVFKESPATNTFGYTLFAVMFAAVINVILFLPRGHLFLTVFDNKVFRLYGKHSYAIYIFHPLVNTIVWIKLLEQYQWEYFPASISYFILSINGSLLVSWVLWHLFEKHFLRLKRFFCKEVVGTEQLRPKDVVPSVDKSGR
ncbi:MAG: acyltransferase [Geobacteraceae bacterium]|nr:acyltransferase [Geobacteraceae bacterium]